MTEDELLQEMRQWFPRARDHSKEWRTEAKQNYSFHAGHQLTAEEIQEYEEDLRAPIVFNRIQPMVSAVKGQQINNRQEVRYLPREMGDVQVSELLTGAAQWVDDECDAEDELTDVFEDLLICGMGWSDTYLSYDEEIDGKIHSAERINPMEMYWDSSAKRRNLKDAQRIAQARWVKKSLAVMRWPEVADMNFGDVDTVLWAEDESSDEPHDAARAHFYEHDARQWYDKHRDEVFLIRTQWWEHKPFYRIGDPQSGRILEFSDVKFQRIKPYLEANGVQYVRQLKKTYFQAFIIGPKVLEMGDNPCPDDFTLRCVTGKRDAMKGHWFGLVRGMVDPQKWGNKFYSDIQDMITSNRLGGAFVEQSALVDPRQAEEQWNDPNPLILVQDGALGKGAIQERNPIPYPQGLDRMLEWAVQALPAVTGINLEMMGFADRDQPNVLEVQRKRSALTVLADLFDSLRRFNKERGRVVLYFIQTYISDGRLIRITGQNGKEQYVPLALDDENVKYDIIVDEAASSPNQREETFAVLAQLIPFFAKVGVMPPVDVLEYLPLPSSLVAKWKDQLQPDEPQPPSPEEVLAIEKEQSEIEKNRAQAAEAEAKRQKTIAEAQAQDLENKAVRLGIVSVEDV